MSAGELDRKITLQTRSVARDADTGAEVVSWSDSATVSARVFESATAPSASGAAAAQMTTYARPHRVRIRWRTVDKSTSRVSYGGRLLRIISTAEVGRREYVDLACEEWAHE